MQQMSQYTATQSGKFGPRLYNAGSFRNTMVFQNITQKPDKDCPILIKPEAKPWMVWDKQIKEYINSNISIIKEENKNEQL